MVLKHFLTEANHLAHCHTVQQIAESKLFGKVNLLHSIELKLHYESKCMLSIKTQGCIKTLITSLHTYRIFTPCTVWESDAVTA